MPLLLLTVQLHHGADKARVRSDAEQSLGVGLRIDGVPGIRGKRYEQQYGGQTVKRALCDRATDEMGE